MKTRYRTIAIMTLTLAVTSAYATNRTIGPAVSHESQLVYLGDLDLQDPGEANEAQRRIGLAARKVCDVRQGRLTLAEKVSRNACYDRALDDARRVIDGGSVRAE
ncbi:MAG: UrcA family protein [Proteobacteria bacterium]|jgi:UrcA family protein|nr:UrcA family protein [Pseudomonadota bacterium]MDA1299322.1 UrcA family protein [Pseudomonadota bacterium]